MLTRQLYWMTRTPKYRCWRISSSWKTAGAPAALNAALNAALGWSCIKINSARLRERLKRHQARQIELVHDSVDAGASRLQPPATYIGNAPSRFGTGT